MQGVAHREGKGVVGQDGLNRIGQRGGDVLQERRSGGTGGFGRDRHDCFPAEVIDGGKLEVMPGIAEGRQEFEIDVHELPGPALFKALRFDPRGPRQLIHAMGLELALDRALAHRQRRARSAPHSVAGRATPESARASVATAPSATCGVGGCGAAGPRDRRPGSAPPARQHLAGDAELRGEGPERHALLVHRHQLGSNTGSWATPRMRRLRATHLTDVTSVLVQHTYQLSAISYQLSAIS